MRNKSNMKNNDINKNDLNESANGSDIEKESSVNNKKINDELDNEEISQLLDELDLAHHAGFEYIDSVDNRRANVFAGEHATFRGDIIKYQKNIIFRSEHDLTKDLAVNLISQNILEKVANIYVPPSTYTNAEEILTKKHIIVLNGMPHFGKETSALQLLYKLHAENIYELDPIADIGKIREYSFFKNAGYIYSPSAEIVGKLDSFTLNSLSDKLRKRKSHMVFIVDTRRSLGKEVMKNYLVNWTALPDAYLVIQKHLKWQLHEGDKLDNALSLLETEEVKQYFHRMQKPREIASLASLLVEATTGTLTLDEALARLEIHTKEQIQNWFDNHPDLPSRSFIISLAILNKSPYQAILEADVTFQSLLAALSNADDLVNSTDIFGTPYARRVKETHAQVFEGYVNTASGLIPVKRIKFDNPSFQAEVIRYVWENFIGIANPLVDFIFQLGFHRSNEIRSKAAAAAGELLKYEFDFIREKIIQPWANDQDFRARLSAAHALGVPVWDNKYSPTALGLLHHWSTLKNNWRLTWTATVAYGSLVGLRFPSIAFQDLFMIAINNDKRHYRVTKHSIINLFKAGHLSPDFYLIVIDSLIYWTGDIKNKNVTLTGLLSFLKITADVNNEGRYDAEKYPTLLRLMKKDKFAQERIIILWQRALNFKESRKNALEALQAWIKFEDKTKSLYEILEQLIFGLVINRREREKERILYNLEKWAETSQTAEKLLEILKNRIK